MALSMQEFIPQTSLEYPLFLREMPLILALLLLGSNCLKETTKTYVGLLTLIGKMIFLLHFKTLVNRLLN